MLFTVRRVPTTLYNAPLEPVDRPSTLKTRIVIIVIVLGTGIG